MAQSDLNLQPTALGRITSNGREAEQSVQQGTSRLLAPLLSTTTGTAVASSRSKDLEDTQAGAPFNEALGVVGDVTGEHGTTFTPGATAGEVLDFAGSSHRDGGDGTADGREPDVGDGSGGGRGASTRRSGRFSSTLPFVRSLGRKTWRGRWGGSRGDAAALNGRDTGIARDSDFAQTVKAAEVMTHLLFLSRTFQRVRCTRNVFWVSLCSLQG